MALWPDPVPMAQHVCNLQTCVSGMSLLDHMLPGEPNAVESKKLESGPGAIYAGVPSSEAVGVGDSHFPSVWRLTVDRPKSGR